MMRFLINLLKNVQKIIIFAGCNRASKKVHNLMRYKTRPIIGCFADLSAKL